MCNILYPEYYGAKADGITLDTEAIQKAIDEAGRTKGRVVLRKGVYLSGSIFLQSNMEFILEEEAELRGTLDETQYPILPSRVAGVEMEWPAALLNVNRQKNVKIAGSGTINGQGEFWWNKYWTMRKEYEKKNLRWAVDYDCFRPRNLIIYESEQIVLREFRCIRSGFWNVHICYSSYVLAEDLIIEENQGPSTDGIDIDSSHHVTVKNCQLDCNDDNICLKAGRDYDGLRVNRPCEYIVIENCRIGLGAGITLGSETSGSIHDVVIKNCTFENSMNGFRIKSAKTRGGVIQNILVENLVMENVLRPFSFLLNWNPSYSYCEMPKEMADEYPVYWDVLSKEVPMEKGIPIVKDVTVKNVTVTDTDHKSLAFEIEGFTEAPFEDIRFQNVTIQAGEYGFIKNVKALAMENVTVTAG